MSNRAVARFPLRATFGYGHGKKGPTDKDSPGLGQAVALAIAALFASSCIFMLPRVSGDKNHSIREQRLIAQREALKSSQSFCGSPAAVQRVENG
jgi:hypothetical protein